MVDPELALRLRESDMQDAVVREEDVHDANNGNGSAPTATHAPPEETRSLEALLFHGGLITADQLGDLIREQTATGTPVEELVRARGYVQPEVLDRLLGKTQAAAAAPAAPEADGFTAPIELVPAAMPEPAPTLISAPEPVAIVPVEAPAPAADVVELPTAFAAPEPEPMPVMAEAATAPVLAAAPAPVVELAVAPAPMPEPEPQAEPEPPAAEHEPEPEAQTRPELAFDVLIRLFDGYELLASSHASLADGEQAARALAAGGDWLDVGDGIVQRPAVAAILVRPRSSR